MTTAVAQLSFESVNNFDGHHCYIVPNESLTSWKKVLEDANVNVHRAAGICSSGEIGLFAMLPHVQRELVLVDHSRRSLTVAILKQLILQEYGAEKAQEIFVSGDVKIKEAINKVKDQLPTELKGHYAEVERKMVPHSSYYTRHTFKTFWNDVKDVKTASRGLGKVKFLHGDLTDLVERGPFGLLYLSNALDAFHHSRTGQAALAAVVEKAVRPGGYVLDAVDRYGLRRGKRAGVEWETVADASDGVTGWKHTLYRTPEKKAA